MQILLALKYFHEKEVIHRDLKPDNIFLTDKNQVRNQVKIGDFGIAKELDSKDHLAKTLVGTPNNMAPEVVQGEPYNTKSDIWSFGTILYHLMFK